MMERMYHVPEISEDELDRCREYRDKLSKVVTALEACGPPDVSNIQPRVDANRSLEPRSVLRSPCLLYTSPSPRDKRQSRMPSSA